MVSFVCIALLGQILPPSLPAWHQLQQQQLIEKALTVLSLLQCISCTWNICLVGSLYKNIEAYSIDG